MNRGAARWKGPPSPSGEQRGTPSRQRQGGELSSRDQRATGLWLWLLLLLLLSLSSSLLLLLMLLMIGEQRWRSWEMQSHPGRTSDPKFTENEDKQCKAVVHISFWCLEQTTGRGYPSVLAHCSGVVELCWLKPTDTAPSMPSAGCRLSG